MADLFDDLSRLRRRWVDRLGAEPWGMARFDVRPHQEGWCIDGYINSYHESSPENIKKMFSSWGRVLWISPKNGHLRLFNSHEEARDFVKERFLLTGDDMYGLALEIDEINSLLMMAETVR